MVPVDVNGNFFETIIENFENFSEAKQPNVKKNQTNGFNFSFPQPVLISQVSWTVVQVMCSRHFINSSYQNLLVQ